MTQAQATDCAEIPLPEPQVITKVFPTSVRQQSSIVLYTSSAVGDVLSVSMPDVGVVGPAGGACQHALGVKANVVAEARM